MKVLLANPPCRVALSDSRERYFVRAGSRWPFSITKQKRASNSYRPFPFFLAYAAALIEEDGHDVAVDDAVALELTGDAFVSRALAFAPNVLLFETSTPTFKSDLALIRQIRDALNVTVCLAGPHATVFAKEILENCRDVDYVLTREYEFNLRELVRCLDRRADLSGVPGLASRDASGGVCMTNPYYIEPLDRLPYPARHLFPSRAEHNLDAYWDGFCQYRPAVQMHATRGCPFRCNFCVWTQVVYEQGHYRTFSPRRVVDEMFHVRDRFGAREVYFDDDDFTALKRNVMAFTDELKRRSADVKWSCMGDAMVTDEEMLDAMAETGCIGMKFGVESGDPKILKGIGKPLKLDKVKLVTKWLNERGIKSHATFSYGLLGDTHDTMERTTRFIEELPVDSIQFSISTPFPGTKYYEQLKERGLLFTEEWERYDGGATSAVSFADVPVEEVEAALRRAPGRWLRRRVFEVVWVKRQAHLMGRVLLGQGAAGVLDKARKAVDALRHS